MLVLLNREPRGNRGRARRCSPALFRWKREPFQPCVPLFHAGNGKAAEGAGKSENLPEHKEKPSRTGGSPVKILRIKKGNPRIDLFRSGDFLFSGPGLSQKPKVGGKSNEKKFEFVCLFKLFCFAGI